MKRQTPQRAAILAAFEQAGRPLSPAEALEMASTSVPGVSLATVYRAVRALQEEGQLLVVQLPGQPPRYEPDGLAHHHHFWCNDCGRVYDVPGCAPGVENLRKRGFRVEGHEVLLTGRCADC